MDVLEFRSKLKETEEGQTYLELVSLLQAENRGLRKEKGYEIHHIHPKGLGGNIKEPENLLKVSIFEHIKLHVLLAKALPSYITMKPIVKMSSGQYTKLSDLEKITLEEVDGWAQLREKALSFGVPKSKEAREKISKARKGMTFSEEHKRHLSEARRGLKVSEETRRKQSLRQYGRVAVYNPSLDQMKYLNSADVEDFLGKNEGWRRGKRPASKEQRQKVGNFFKGKPNVNRGSKILNKDGVRRRVHGAEIDQLLQEGWTLGTGLTVRESTRYLMSQNKKGKPSWNRGNTGFLHDYVWITDGEHCKRVKDSEILEEYLKHGWRKGKLPTTSGRKRVLIEGKARYIKVED